MPTDTVAPLRILAVMESARLEVADVAMQYWETLQVPDEGKWDYLDRLHDRLLSACETYAAAREMVIEA
jgi:hypothetical protein